MERKFKVTIGEKTFVVKVEEVTEEESVTPVAQRVPVRPSAVERPPERLAEAAAKAVAPTLGGEGVVRAPMSGVILSIKCRIGDRVGAGDLLLTLEAMKMENDIYSPRSGVVKRIAVSEKQSVNYGDFLVEIG